MAPSCFALQVPDVRGLQVPAAMCFFLAQISLRNVIRTYTEGYTGHGNVGKLTFQNDVSYLTLVELDQL